MRRTLAVAAAATLAVVLAVIPSAVQPAQAVAALASVSCGSMSTLTANCANLPLLVEAGIVSAGTGAGATTAVTGGTAALAAAGGGAAGFNTLLGTAGAAAIGTGVLTAWGISEGVTIATDPGYNPGPSPGQGPTVVYGGGSVTYYGNVGWGSQGGHELCFRATSSTATIRFHRFVSGGTGAIGAADSTPGDVLSSGTSSALAGCVAAFGGVAGQWWAVTGVSASEIVDVYGMASNATIPILWLATSLDVVAPSSGYHGTLRTTVTCHNAAGDSYATATGRVDVEQGGDLPVPAAACGASGLATGVTVEYQADGTTSWVPLATGEAGAYVSTWGEDYPACFVAEVNPCALELQRVNGTTWATCGPVAQFCPDWVREWQDDPTQFRCRYGPYAVTIEHCSAFRKPGVVLPNHDPDAGEDENGDPVLEPPTAPVPNPLPNPVKDPDTGEPVPLPSDVPGSDQEARECWPSGFGIFNPLSWVLMPIRCAFEPSPSKVEQVKTHLRGKWENSAPGVITGGIVGAVGVMGASVAAGGCNGVTIPTGWLNRDAFADAGFPGSFTILDACPGSPLAPWAAFACWVIAVSMVVLAIRVIPGLIGKLVNFGGVSG